MRQRGNMGQLLASVGIGAAAYGIMRARGGNGGMQQMMNRARNMGQQMMGNNNQMK
jgi:hypothetical protein